MLSTVQTNDIARLQTPDNLVGKEEQARPDVEDPRQLLKSVIESLNAQMDIQDIQQILQSIEDGKQKRAMNLQDLAAEIKSNLVCW